MNEQYSPTGFRVLPTIVKNLLIINVLMFLAYITLVRFHIDLNDILGLHFFKASDFRIYQLVTYMFMHGNFGHLFFNMFALWMFGNTLENIWGSRSWYSISSTPRRWHNTKLSIWAVASFRWTLI